MRERMKYYCSLLPVFRLSRGLIALGACSIALVMNMSSIKAYATEADPIEQMGETEVLNNDIVVDDTGSDVVGDTDNPTGSEVGQINEEASVQSESVSQGCTCGQTLIEYYEAKLIESQELTEYEDLAEFEATPAQVSRYEYEILKRLEFMQYTQLILIGLIFILIFKKK